MAVTPIAELRALLRDCATLWSVEARITVRDDAVVLTTDAGPFVVQPADPELRPVRWFVQTPERAQAGRPPYELTCPLMLNVGRPCVCPPARRRSEPIAARR